MFLILFITCCLTHWHRFHLLSFAYKRNVCTRLCLCTIQQLSTHPLRHTHSHSFRGKFLSYEYFYLKHIYNQTKNICTLFSLLVSGTGFNRLCVGVGVHVVSSCLLFGSAAFQCACFVIYLVLWLAARACLCLCLPNMFNISKNIVQQIWIKLNGVHTKKNLVHW